MRTSFLLTFLLLIIPACTTTPYPTRIIWFDGPETDNLRQLTAPPPGRYADKIFNKPVTLPASSKATISEAFDWLSDATHVPFIIHWPALQSINIPPDTNISLPRQSNPVLALASILEQASAGNELDPIDYELIQGVIHISTQRHLHRSHAVTAIYPVSDILSEMRSSLAPPAVDHSVNLAAPAAPANPPNSLFHEFVPAEQTQAVFRLSELIQSIGRPEHWVAYGGDIASVYEINGRLIIRAPIDYHMQTWRLLLALRQTRPNVR